MSIPCAAWLTDLPDAEAVCRHAATLALSASGLDFGGAAVEVGVVLADDDCVRRLNRDFRGRDEATNVLSFAATEPEALKAQGAGPQGVPVSLGDVFVALQTSRAEAHDQDKPFGHHLSHLVVHGTLHLVGYDHEAEGSTETMEALEALVLARLGVPDPYAPRPPAPS